MNKDFRISTSFWQHRKTAKLQRLLGRDGVWSLLKLWTWTAINQPDGFLPLDAEDIEFVSDWTGEPGQFVSTAVEIGWLDEADGGYEVHDWVDHNEWASEAVKRGEEARLSRLFGKHRELAQQIKDMGVTGITQEEYHALKRGGLAAFAALRPGVTASVERPFGESLDDRVTTVGRPFNDRTTVVERIVDGSLTPTPAPAPAYVKEKDSPPSPPRGGGERDEPDDEADEPKRRAQPDCPHQAIIDLYHEILPQCPKVKTWNGYGKKQLAIRWREDKARQSIDWWRDIFGKVAQSDFLMGRKPNTTFLFSLGWFVGPKNFEKVLNDHFVNHTPAEPGGIKIGRYTF